MGDIYNRVLDILKNVLNDSNLNIDQNTNLVNDLGMDSIVLMMFVIEIEKTFDIELPDDFFDIDTISNLGAVIAVVKTQLNDRKNGGT